MTADEFEAVAKMAVGGVLIVKLEGGQHGVGIGEDGNSFTFGATMDQNVPIPRDGIIAVSRSGSGRR